MEQSGAHGRFARSQVVSVMEEEIFSAQRNHLIQIVRQQFVAAQPQSKALAIRLLSGDYLSRIGVAVQESDLCLGVDPIYGGYPEVARLGYLLAGSYCAIPECRDRFLSGISRLRQRTARASHLAGDDISILGIADGLASVSDCTDQLELDAVKQWFTELLSSSSVPIYGSWTSLMRTVASNLVDNGGRVPTAPSSANIDAQALYIVMWHVWPKQFGVAPAVSPDSYRALFSQLLRYAPSESEFEKAVIWLKSLDLLVERSSTVLFPKSEREALAISQLAEIKNKLESRAEKRARLVLWAYVGVIALVWLFLGLLTYRYGWDTMEPWITFLGVPATIGPYIYFALTKREFTLHDIFHNIKNRHLHKLFRETGFDLDKYHSLTFASDTKTLPM